MKNNFNNHSEIQHNLQAVSSAGYEYKILEELNYCAELPTNDADAIRSLNNVAFYLQDNIYKAKLDEIDNLPAGEVAMVVKYYNAVSRFKGLANYFSGEQKLINPTKIK